MIILNQNIKLMQNCSYMDTESFVISIKTEDFEDTAEDVENRFDTFDLIQIMKDDDRSCST